MILLHLKNMKSQDCISVSNIKEILLVSSSKKHILPYIFFLDIPLTITSYGSLSNRSDKRF